MIANITRLSGRNRANDLSERTKCAGGFQELLNHDAGRVSRPGKLYVYGNRGVAEWSYVDTDESGQSTIIRGCDLFEFDGDMIKLKNAFRKCQL